MIHFRLSKNILIGAFIAALVMFLIAKETGVDLVGYLGIAVMLLGIVQAGIFCRCPECGAPLLRRRGGIPKYCPECGYHLEEDKK